MVVSPVLRPHCEPRFRHFYVGKDLSGAWEDWLACHHDVRPFAKSLLHSIPGIFGIKTAGQISDVKGFQPFELESLRFHFSPSSDFISDFHDFLSAVKIGKKFPRVPDGPKVEEPQIRFALLRDFAIGG